MRQNTLICILFLGLYGAVALQAEGSTAAACDCAYTHPLETYKLDGAAVGLEPGDVVCLGSGVRGNLRITNVVGSPTQPITIQNCGGPLDIQTTTFGITMDNNRYLRVTGTGDPNTQYGIQVGGQVGVQGLTSDVEMDHIEVYKAVYTGMSVKTDPTCDPATWRDNFTMENVSIHDNFIHDVGGEGFYIGYTFYFGKETTCNGEPTTLYGHLIDGLEVYNNVTHNTAREGIQVHSAPLGNARVFDNRSTLYGQNPGDAFQNNGMQIGSANIELFNNYVAQGPGIGLIIFGEGHRVYNNVVVDAGSHGVFATDQQNAGPGQHYFNNTIVTPGEDGLRFFTDGATTPSQAKNNLIVAPGSGNFIVKVSQDVALVSAGNLSVDTLAEAKFNNPGQADYRLQSLSPAVDAGVSVAGDGVTFDFLRTPRPLGAGYDVGAYEYAPPTEPLDEFVYLPLVVD